MTTVPASSPEGETRTKANGTFKGQNKDVISHFLASLAGSFAGKMISGLSVKAIIAWLQEALVQE